MEGRGQFSMIKTKQLIGITAISLLAACGGGGGSTDSDGGSTGKSQETEIGVFLDSSVINMDYQTETLSGATNSSGQYEYIPGETVTFSIGDLTFPVTNAQSTVTPIDIANAQDASDTTVLNMIRLLQTLDADGNPANGITITDAAKAAATPVDFTSLEFESLSAVTNLISNAGQNTATQDLVSSQDALAHFETELEKNGLIEAQYYQVKLDLPNPFGALNKVTLNEGAISFEELFTSNDESLDSWSSTYSIATDGRVTIGGVDTVAKNANGTVMIGVDTDTDDNDVGISIFTKFDTSLTVSDLGSHFYCASLDSEPYSAFYKMSFYANGQGEVNSIGNSADETGSDNFTYSIDQGMLSVTGSNSTVKGGITNDASVLTLTEFTADMDEGITICVKASTQANNTTLAGTYYGAHLDSEPYTAFNAMSFDGAGNAISTELSVSGDESDTDVELSYQVDRTGQLTLADSVLGAISLDGSVVIYANTNSSNDLSFGVLVKSE